MALELLAWAAGKESFHSLNWATFGKKVRSSMLYMLPLRVLLDTQIEMWGSLLDIQI